MLEFVHQLWLTQNGHLHQTDISTAPSYKRLQLLQEIRELYTKRYDMLVNDRAIFLKNITTFEDKTTDNLNRFIQHSTPIVRQSIKDAKQYGKKFRRIPDYFPKPKPPPEPDP